MRCIVDMYFRNIRKLSLGRPGKRVGQQRKLQLGGVRRNGQLWKLQLGGKRRTGHKRWKLKSPAYGDKVPNGVV